MLLSPPTAEITSDGLSVSMLKEFAMVWLEKPPCASLGRCPGVPQSCCGGRELKDRSQNHSKRKSLLN